MSGLAGHMSHLHEDRHLTFGDLKCILYRAHLGKLHGVTEKLDGQNTYFTYGPFGLRFARNKSHIASGGISLADIHAKWADKPSVAEAFGEAYKALSQGLTVLAQWELQNIFNNGNTWYSAEIVGRLNPNVIHYDTNAVVLHRSGNHFDHLVSCVSRMQKYISHTGWQILSPVNVSMPRCHDNEALLDAIELINRVQGDYVNDNTLGDMFEEYLVEKHLSNLDIDDDDKLYIAELISDFDTLLTAKKPYVANLLPKIYHAQIHGLLKDGPKLYADFVEPIREVFFTFGIRILSNVQSGLIYNPANEIERLRREVEQEIANIDRSGDERSKILLQKELSRLGDIGNVSSSIEGVVFSYNGSTYKLTGSFAPINQILGIGRYGR